jgi:hypothetical protein
MLFSWLFIFPLGNSIHIRSLSNSTSLALILFYWTLVHTLARTFGSFFVLSSV